jgi:hypothetical protein
MHVPTQRRRLWAEQEHSLGSMAGGNPRDTGPAVMSSTSSSSASLITVQAHHVPSADPALPGLVVQVTRLQDSYMLWVGLADTLSGEDPTLAPARGALSRDWACAMPSMNVCLPSSGQHEYAERSVAQYPGARNDAARRVECGPRAPDGATTRCALVDSPAADSSRSPPDSHSATIQEADLSRRGRPALVRQRRPGAAAAARGRACARRTPEDQRGRWLRSVGPCARYGKVGSRSCLRGHRCWILRL